MDRLVVALVACLFFFDVAVADRGSVAVHSVETNADNFTS
jgi:hypothetical protein